MLQFSPLLEMRQAGTHIAGFKPGVAPSLAAVGTDVTGWTFVTIAGMRLIDRLFENFPTVFHRAGAKIITRDREGGAEVHFTVGSNGKAGLPAYAFDEGLLSRTRDVGQILSAV